MHEQGPLQQGLRAGGSRAEDQDQPGDREPETAAHRGQRGQLLAGVVEALRRQGRLEAQPAHGLGAQGQPQALAQAPDEVRGRMQVRNLAQEGQGLPPQAQQQVQGVDHDPDQAEDHVPLEQALGPERGGPQGGPPGAKGWRCGLLNRARPVATAGASIRR
jgi:hypothetical protein